MREKIAPLSGVRFRRSDPSDSGRTLPASLGTSGTRCRTPFYRHTPGSAGSDAKKSLHCQVHHPRNGAGISSPPLNRYKRVRG